MKYAIPKVHDKIYHGLPVVPRQPHAKLFPSRNQHLDRFRSLDEGG